jgi:hypothetical protein
MTERSKLYRLIERGLGSSLVDLVAKRRTYDYSWAAIAREVSDQSGIEVSDETLCRWFRDSEMATAGQECAR